MSDPEEFDNSTNSESENDTETSADNLAKMPIQVNIVDSCSIGDTCQPGSSTNQDPRSLAGPSNAVSSSVAHRLIAEGILPMNDGFDHLRLQISGLQANIMSSKQLLVSTDDEQERQGIRTTIEVKVAQLQLLIVQLPPDPSDDDE